MEKNLILFADNDRDFLDTRRQFLEDAGYVIFPVYTEEETRKQLRENKEIDLAILDIRLIEDEDEKDYSGLEIACELARRLPKIILTSFPTTENVRQGLKVLPDGLPPAVDFVAKQEGPSALLAAIRYALGPEADWLRRTKLSLVQNDKILEADYKAAQFHSWFFFTFSILAAVGGIAFLFHVIDVILSAQVQNNFGLEQQITVGILSAISSAITGAITILFIRRSDAANQRMDRFRYERLQGRRYEILLDTCNTIASPIDKESCRIEIIHEASAAWLKQQLVEKKEG